MTETTAPQCEHCELREYMRVLSNPWIVRVTPLQFIPIEHQPLPPSGTDGPALAGFNSEVAA